MKRELRAQIKHLEQHGFSVRVHRASGKHVILRVRQGRRSGLLTLSVSPSDHRVYNNNLSCARRACGVA